MRLYTIRFTVVSIFILATLITASIAIGLQWHFSKKMATESAQQLFSLTSEKTQENLRSIDSSSEKVTALLAKFADLIDGNELKESAFPIFTEILENSNKFFAIYVGFPNGNFHELINLDASPYIRKQVNAALTDKWVILIISNENGIKKRSYQYLNDDLRVRTTRYDIGDYEVTSRPWYINATDDEVFKTKPYMFQHLQAPGQTYSMKIPGTEAVLGVDIALSSLEKYLTQQSVNNEGEIDKEIYLFQKTGEIIASNQTNTNTIDKIEAKPLALSNEQQALVASTPILKVSNEIDWAPIDFSVAGQPRGYSIDVLSLISQMTGLNFEYTNGLTWPDLVYSFDSERLDILQPLFKTAENNPKGVYSLPFIDLPFSVITLPGIEKINSLTQLEKKTLAIPQGWSITPLIKKYFPKINIKEYGSSKAVLEAVSQGRVYAGLDNDIIFRYTQQQFFINDIEYHTDIDFGSAHIDTSLHFMVHKSQQALVDIINLAITHITPEQLQLLNKKWLLHKKTSSNSTKESSAKENNAKANKVNQLVVPYVELIEMANDEIAHGELTSLTLNNLNYFIYLTPITDQKTEFMAIIVPSATVFASSIEKVKLSILFTSVALLFILPISWLFSGPIVKPIKLLAIENEKIKNRQYDDVKHIKSNIKEIDALAKSLVKMSAAINSHQTQQQELMDSFIKLIAQTIDDKSPYTGGHCNRVPELGLLLVDAALKDEEHFKDFKFKSADEMREFKISAWLHDCGKIITPEHIVDKGSKLEAIYNRIHEVRMRFEVLWLTAEVDYYKALIAQPDKEETLHNKLIAQQIQLKEDFAFVAEANVGGEFMAEDKIERLRQISKKTWQRNFDDRLGLSPAEEAHLTRHNLHPSQESSQQLPITESLLSDKAEHLFSRAKRVECHEKFGIKMTVPENRANLGEIYNLSISRGTLTTEDRYRINEHIIGTIKMLDQLPFPPELANVPRYASTHHETLIGTGYPRQLTAEDLTVPERILVIADIFEALTASDRPYKKAKPLSVAIKILHQFAVDKHIDFALFELFLTSGIYLVYAKRYMPAEQIDDVDITQYLRS